MKGLTLDSAAALLMTDFTKTPATTANDSISINDALELMRVNRIRALMIVGHNGEFAGVITAMDLMGRKPMLYANESGIQRVDVLVKDIMLPKYKLKAVSRGDIEKSTIGDVMNTFMTLNEQHILVVEDETDDMSICGLFSASDFKRALGITIESPVVAQTFFDLERVINEHKEVM
jgi:CBS domain-containing protein